MAGVVLSSALSPTALLCLLPGEQPGQSIALPDPTAPGAAPCCWRVSELQKAASATAAASGAADAAVQAKALHRASRYAGCRIWRRHA